MAEHDAIVVGAGHNGLAAANVLARAGRKVLVLERNGFVGGMAATRELFKGYRHNVGAWALLVLPDEMIEHFELKQHGFEVLTPRTSYCVFGAPEDPPFIFYTDLGEMMQNLLRLHGTSGVEGMAGVIDHVQVFAKVMGEQRLRAPESFDRIIAAAPDARTREILAQSFYGSALEIVRKHFPDPDKHRCIQASLCAMSIDATHLGPYSPGSGCSMMYHYTASGSADMFKMPKSGIGAVSEALHRSLEAHGGKVRLRSEVSRILIEGGRAVGVELRSGERLSAGSVLCTTDARTTFLELVGEERLPSPFVHAVKEIDYRNGYIQLHLTLSELPRFEGHLAFANDEDIRWLMAYIPSPEHLSRCWESYRRDEVPADPVAYCYIPSVVDPSLAPAGRHACTIFSHYFPLCGSAQDHDQKRDLMAERVIESIGRWAPNFRRSIVDKAVLTHRYFEATFGITGGDFSHGLLHPGQMWHRRPVPGWSDFRTPVEGLFLCGSGSHPGPGVTCMPGYNGAHAALAAEG